MADEKSKLEQLIEGISAKLPTLNDDIKALAEKTNTEIKNLGGVQAETKARADEVLAKQGELGARLTDVEQKLARAGGGAAEAPKSLGQIVIQNEEVKALAGVAGKTKVQVNINKSLHRVNAAITSVTSDTDGAAGDLVRPDRETGIVVPPRRELSMRSLVMPGRTQSNAVEYAKRTGYTNNARVVTEGQQKPESTLKYELFTIPVVTVAHHMNASRQILSDAAQLQSEIDGELRWGLMDVEDREILMGSGASGNLNGIYTQATAFSAAFTPESQSAIDIIRLALLQAALSDYQADAIVLNETDWARMELQKDAENRYLVANPFGQIQRVLWGRRVVINSQMPEDKFLVGAFRMGATLYDRESVSVVISTEHGDNLTTNMVTILAEMRLALGVKRTEAFIKGDLGNVT